MDQFKQFANGSRCVNVNCYRFPSQCLDKNLDIFR